VSDRGLRELNRREWEGRLAAPEGKYRFDHRYRIAHARILSAGPARWLDVGTGNGFLPSIVKPDFPSVHVTGIDFVPEALAAATALDAARVVDLDAEGLPFDDGAFDYVSCLEVLEHVVLARQLLSEIQRVLAPGGRALVSVPNIQFIEHSLAFLRGKVPRPAADPRHMGVFTLTHLRKLMGRAGLHADFAAGCDASPAWLARLSLRFFSKTLVVEGRKASAG